MRIPDELIPLVSELAEASLDRLLGDQQLTAAFLPPSHPRRIEIQRRLALTRRLVHLVRAQRVAA